MNQQSPHQNVLYTRMCVLLTCLWCTAAVARPTGSETSLKPSLLSVGLTSSVLLKVDSALYVGNVQSSAMSVSQTYPEVRSSAGYQTSPIEFRLSPSLFLLTDDGRLSR